MHPRLLTSLILVEAVMPSRAFGDLWPMGRRPTFRKDLWPTRAAAEATLRKSPLLKPFDPRVVNKVLNHSIRPTPTLLYPMTPDPDTQEQPYTLTTTKHQEAFSIARPNHGDVAAKGPVSVDERHAYPDIWPTLEYKSPFYKPEGHTCWQFLPHLRASVLWLYGGNSYAADPEERRKKLERTGAGWNGSGGFAHGRVKEGIIQGSGHFPCFEKIDECAAMISGYLEEEMGVWRKGEEVSIDEEWRRKDIVGKQTMDKKWLTEMKTWKGQRPLESKL